MATGKKKVPVSRRTKPEPRDDITIDNRGNRNVIAAGRHALAAVFNINIRDLKWQPVVIVLLIVGLLLFAILWFVIPKTPTVMSGQFNVAVAEFLIQDANGKTVSGIDGSLLASYVEKQIGSQFAEIELNKTVPYEVWGPKETGIIGGNTPAERSEMATKLAKKIHAHIVIYGVIVANGSQSKLIPEFYVNYAAFQDASEITGTHEIGGQLRVELPFENSIQAITNPALAGRVNALDLVTLGLAYYSIDDFKNALVYFQRAVTEERWVGGGKEVVYLLIGNAYVRQASKFQDFSDLPLAAQNYETALENNSKYGRAMIGLSSVLYLKASLDKNNCDPAGLDQGSVLLDQALSLKDQPVSANIETKVHYYRGQIALIRNACQIAGNDWLTLAEQEFTWVVNQYESRKDNQQDYESVEFLTSHAYARLGYIDYQRNNWNAAIAFIQKAIPISSPFYQGEYTSFLGDIYAANGSKEQAVNAYQDAISIAETNGDAESAKKYQQKLQSISEG